MTTIIRSTDSAAVSAGAILHGNAGSLVAVLDYCLVTVLGWGKPFSATNKAVYRAPAGVRHYLDVDDSGPDATALGRNARIRAYETMSAVATGTNAFPTTTQVTTAVGVVKSTATGTTARPWIMIGDDRTFYFLCEPAGADPPNLLTHNWTDGFFFGEIFSSLTSDVYRTIFGYHTATSAAVTASTAAYFAVTASSTGTNNQVMARTYTGAGGSLWVTMMSNWYFNAGMVGESLFTSFPNPVDSGIYLSLVDVGERGAGTTPASLNSSKGIRGRMRGLYTTMSNGSGFNDQDTFSGVGDYAGLSFIILKVQGSSAGGALIFDTGTWPAST